MSKKKWVSVLALVCMSSVSAAETKEEMDQNLSEVSSGTGRFTHGTMISVGYNKQDNFKNIANSQFTEAAGSGFELSIGYSVAFAPIRDFNEVEIGAGYKMAIATDKKGSSVYDTNIYAPFVYAGLIFPMKNGAAIGAGVQLDFSGKMAFEPNGGDQEITIDGVKSKGRKLVYVEYQFGKSAIVGSKSFFARLGVGDFSYSTLEGDQKVRTAQLSVGFKL